MFSVDYWPGLPGVEQEGRPDVRWDLEHFKSYADPIGVRAVAGALADPEINRADRCWFTTPDLLSATETELRDWQREWADDTDDLLTAYVEAGIQCIAMTALFCCSGQDSAPDWYKALADWEECTALGTPLSEAGLPSLSCLLHPEMYQVVDRFWACHEFIAKRGVLLGVCLENEPSLGLGERPRYDDFGGNPHSRAAFSAYAAEQFPDVAAFNQVAGTAYESFEHVRIGDDNWLVRALAARFKHTIIMGHHVPQLAALAKKHFPDVVTITRMSSGLYVDERDHRTGSSRYAGEKLGVEPTMLKDSDVDIIGFSHWSYDGDDGHQEGFGGFQVTCNLCRGTEKMLGITEPMVGRHGVTNLSLRTEEMMHFVYRGLHYNFRLFNIHSWARSGDRIYDEPFGMVLSQKPGFLPAVRALRDGLDWIAPFQTFGKPVLPPIRILVSRNSRGFPGCGLHLYFGLLRDLCSVFEAPEFSEFEIVEEQSRDLDEALAGARGVVVMDACLEDSTTRRLEEFIRNGGKLLVFTTPARVGPSYEPADWPDWYPAVPRAPLAPSNLKTVQRTLAASAGHALWPAPSPLELWGSFPLLPRDVTTPIAFDSKGEWVGSADTNVACLAGPPADWRQLRALLLNFAGWCDVETRRVVVSQFEQSTVVQNYDSRNLDSAGRVIDPAAWSGHVPLNGTHRGQIRELRGDFPWLAYSAGPGAIEVEAVGMPPLDIKVFRKEQDTSELPHFEGFPAEVGFSRFWRGDIHLVIGEFQVRDHVQVRARFVPVRHAPRDVGWFVCEVEGERVAEGVGCDVAFEAGPGRRYYLTALTRNHPAYEQCPLCRHSRFE